MPADQARPRQDAVIGVFLQVFRGVFGGQLLDLIGLRAFFPIRAHQGKKIFALVPCDSIAVDSRIGGYGE